MNDLISREALKKAISDEFDLAVLNGNIMLISKVRIVSRILAIIDNAPTVDINKEIWTKSNELLEKRLTYLKKPQGEFTLNELKGYLLFYGYSSDAVEDTLINFESYVKGKRGGTKT